MDYYVLLVKFYQQLVQHDIFKRQWLKRLLFYQKNNYKIVLTKDYKENNWDDISKKNSKKDKELTKELPMGKCLISI